MNHRIDHENLLAEVLAEASPPEFRASLLAEILRHARRRRRWRRARQVFGVLIIMGLLASGMMRWFSSPPAASSPPVTVKIAAPSYELVRTQPLPASALVRTHEFSEAQFTLPEPAFIEIVTISGGYHRLNDDELMLLLGGKPAVLIRTGPDSKELVFANPEDQRKLLFVESGNQTR
jgi:hypothetical protein